MGIYSPSVYPAFKMEAWLSGDGGATTDISRDVAQRTIAWGRGMQGGNVDDLVAPVNALTFALNNYADVRSGYKLGYYSPLHANKRTGWGLDVLFRFSLQDPTTRTWYPQFVGRIDRIDPAPGLYRTRRVEVTVVDWMDEASRWKLTPAIGEQIEKRADEILAAIVAEMPRQPTALDFDEGADIYPFALDQSTSGKQSALSEMVKIQQSERGPLFINRSGTLRQESRHHRLTNTTVAWVIDDTVIHGADGALAVQTAREDIVHTVIATTHPKVIDALPTTVLYSQANAIFIPAGATKTLMGPYRDPVTGDPVGGTEIQALVAGTDYRFNADQSGAGADLSSDLDVTMEDGPSGVRFELENTGATDGWIPIDGLQVRGKAVKDHGTQDFTSTDGDESGVTLVDLPYQVNPEVGQAAADFLRTKFGTSRLQAQSVKVRGTTPAKVTQLLQRDVSDRVTIKESVTGINGDAFINGVRGEYLPGGILDVTYVLSPATAALDYFTLDSDALGGAAILAPF